MSHPCANCGIELSNGYQSSGNLDLCVDCYEWEQQSDCEGGDSCTCNGEDDRTTFDMSDDADALASAGWGTDEDYGCYGDEG